MARSPLRPPRTGIRPPRRAGHSRESRFGSLAARLAPYRAALDRPEFHVLLFPLVLLILKDPLHAAFHSETVEGWSFVVCIFWGPLMVLHIYGLGQAWDDFKRPSYPRELALLALLLNILAPFAVIYFILYS